MIKALITPSSSQRDLLFITAAAVAAVAGLRSAELLGSRTYPDRALTLSQFEFFIDDQSLNPRGIHVPSNSASIPTHCILHLLVSKTNQTRKDQFTPIAESTALALIWRLYNIRGVVPNAVLMFQQGSERPMRMTQLIAFLQYRIGTERHLTSRCFRIGAASSLIGKGVSIADVAENCHWTPTSSMPMGTYADVAALRRRAIVGINRAMT